mmetsp:Transcript_34596/g.101656  ORF Transcript_34596/g.101656 Transcript_34596/m.101656 type:complete len:219 (-) Transcript_34596:184-840(-)
MRLSRRRVITDQRVEAWGQEGCQRKIVRAGEYRVIKRFQHKREDYTPSREHQARKECTDGPEQKKTPFIFRQAACTLGVLLGNSLIGTRSRSIIVVIALIILVGLALLEVINERFALFLFLLGAISDAVENMFFTVQVLELHQTPIFAVGLLHELLMSSNLANSTGINDSNARSMAHRRQTMSNDDGGLMTRAHHVVQSCLHNLLRFRIKRRCSFVEQ